MRADQVRDPVGEHTSLARPGAGDDEERAVDVQHGLALGRVEACEQLLVRRDRHEVDASRGLRQPMPSEITPRSIKPCVNAGTGTSLTPYASRRNHSK